MAIKRANIIDKDLTEAGVSVVNIGNTAFLRYARVFQRKEKETLKLRRKRRDIMARQ